MNVNGVGNGLKKRDFPKTVAEIERDVLKGKRIGSSDMNRFMRSYRGQMFIAAMQRNGVR